MTSHIDQKGMTFIGWVIVLAIIGFFAMVVIKLVPIYLEYQSVVSAMQAVAAEDNRTPGEIRASLGKKLDINNVTVVKAADFEILREDGGITLAIEYEARTNFVANIDIVVNFSKAVELKGVASE